MTRTVCRECGQSQSNVGFAQHESDRAYTVRNGKCRTCAAKTRITRRLLCGCVAGETVEECVPCGEHGKK
jgi:hypothetical protein